MQYKNTYMPSIAGKYNYIAQKKETSFGQPTGQL